ncbi:MAG: cyclase family protein [Myxococcota bacterium]
MRSRLAESDASRPSSGRDAEADVDSSGDSGGAPFDNPFQDAIDDALFDAAAVEAGAWSPGPYGPGDELGTYHEVTPVRRAAALAMLDLAAPIATFGLGDTLFEGYPAFGDRAYHQRLVVSGFVPDPPFAGETKRERPWGPNRMTSLEERVATSYNLGSKINGLLHCGVGSTFYGGRRAQDLVADHGVRALDTTTWGPPLVTRGLLLDVLGLKQALGEEAALETTRDGSTVLRGGYRITVEDLEAARERQALPDFEPGDALLIRTGWIRLVRTDPDRYRAASPGPFLREARFLARTRPALVGIDSWMFATSDAAVAGRTVSPTLQLLLVRYGIRVGEGLNLEALAEAGVDRFVFCHSPLRADGATASSAPAMAIANLRRGS